MKLSITIISFNEAQNIAQCIESARFADEIIVVDSNSSDNTLEIAQKLGAKVYSRDFDGYGQQKNYAAELCSNEWILNIDADEEISQDLQSEITKILENPKHNLYRINRITQFCGKWIKHGGWYPNYISRLYRKDKARWTEPNVHEDLKLNNPQESIGKIEQDLNHYSFPTIRSQIDTNSKYANLGAKDLISKKGRRPYLFELITRPCFKFIECYLLKGGILDGIHGFIIAINAAHSMFMKYSTAYLEYRSITNRLGKNKR